MDVQLYYQYGFKLILIYGVHLITSSFLDIYKIERDRDVVEGIDDHESVDVELTNNSELQTIHAVEENTISFDVNRDQLYYPFGQDWGTGSASPRRPTCEYKAGRIGLTPTRWQDQPT